MQNLFATYRAQEIASGVIVMQCGNVSESISGRILKVGIVPLLNFIPAHLTGIVGIWSTWTPSMSTCSTKIYPLGPSFLLTSVWIPFTQEGRQFSKSSTTCVLDNPFGLPPTTRVILHMVHCRHFSVMIFRRCRGLCYTGQLQGTACAETRKQSRGSSAKWEWERP